MNLPKFIIADERGKRAFVIHTQTPRFIMEVLGAGPAGTPVEWIDIATEPVSNLENQALEFYCAQMDKPEARPVGRMALRLDFPDF